MQSTRRVERSAVKCAVSMALAFVLSGCSDAEVTAVADTSVADSAECTNASDCEAPTTACRVAVCDLGSCTTKASDCGCQSQADCEAKNDDDLCTPDLYCELSTNLCVLNPATVVTCPDTRAGACLKWACDSSDGKCVTVPDNKSSCDDGKPCTSDACKAGVCVGTVSGNCSCSATADCAKQEDGNPCNGTLYCDMSSKDVNAWQCVTNPTTKINCPTFGNTACLKSVCDAKDGVCKATVQDPKPAPFKGEAKESWSSCDSDGTHCSQETCDKGVCELIRFLPSCGCKGHADCAVFEDGNACNGTLFCNMANGACALNPATQISCPISQDGACRKIGCDAKSGKCQMVVLPAGSPCLDGSPCTAAAACQKGQCELTKSKCACKNHSDCTPFEKDITNKCLGAKLYCDKAKGSCRINPSTRVLCDTSNDTQCSKSRCEPKTGKCAGLAATDGSYCEADGSPCTAADRCVAGACKVSENVCKCALNKDCAPFDDANTCNGTLYCDTAAKETSAWRCVINKATVKICSSADEACKPNLCDPKTGSCAPVKRADGYPCAADDSACSQGGCAAGVCKVTHNLCQCPFGGGCLHFEDGNKCNGTLYCDKTGDQSTWACKVNPATTITCTPNTDVCSKSVCDENDGACKPEPHSETEACDDGSVCTSKSSCQGGKCLPNSGELNCDDANVCTTDSCDKVKGCVHAAPANLQQCDDGDACNGPEACKDSKCSNIGDGLDCDDTEPCTTDSCAPLTGDCVHANATENSSCGGASVCKTGQCKAPVCGGKATVCNKNAECGLDDEGEAVCNCPVGLVGDGKVCGVLEQIGQLAPAAGNKGDAFGAALAVSGDLFAVGSPGDDNTKGNDSGAVYLFERDKDGVITQAAVLYAVDVQAGARFGAAVAMQGQKLVVGAPLHDINPTDVGTTYVFDIELKSNKVDKVTQTAALGDKNFSEGAKLGSAVLLMDSLVVSGAPGYDAKDGKLNTGAVFVYKPSGKTYAVAATLSPDQKGKDQQFGATIAAEGDRLVVAAPGAAGGTANAGAVYIWDKSGPSTFTKIAKFFAAKQHAADGFGAAVAISDNIVVVGAPGDDAKGKDSGAVLIFEQQGSNFKQFLKLHGPTPKPGDSFGAHLALDDPLLVVGVPMRDGKASDEGAVCIFDRQPTGGAALQVEVTSSQALKDAHFGSVVSVNGTQIVSTAPQAQSKASSTSLSGKVFILKPAVDCKTAFCSDGNLCTKDECDDTKGCVYTQLTEGSACDDNSKCTTSDTCKGGQCQPGKPLSCDDSNDCTSDACSPSAGCIYENRGSGATSVQLVAGSVVVTAGYKDGKGAQALFNRPLSLAVGPDKVIYVADTMNQRIRRIANDGTVTTVAGAPQKGTGSGWDPDHKDGKGSVARFAEPHGIAVDGNGVLYVTDYVTHVIRRIAADGEVTTLAGAAKTPCANTASKCDGAASSAKFNHPWGIDVDSKGVVYVADMDLHAIRRITVGPLATNVTTVAGGNVDPQSKLKHGLKDGLGAGALFYRPRGIALHPDGGSLYVADHQNNAVRSVLLSNGAVTTVAGGSAAGGHKDAKGSLAQFKLLEGVAVDDLGGVYVADKVNFRLRRVASDGSVTTIAGSGLVGSVDGLADLARLNYPADVAILSDTKLIFADSEGHQIRQLNLSVSCSDGDACTGGDLCDQGSCKSGAKLTCDDGNPCTTDSCDKIKGCLHAALKDDTVCGDNHLCKSGLCAPQKSTCGDGTRDKTEQCDDNNTKGSDGCSSKCTRECKTPKWQVSTLSSGTGTQKLNIVRGLAIDFSDNIYAADSQNHRLLKYSPKGVGTVIAADLKLPVAVAVDAIGNLYVANGAAPFYLRKLTAKGTVLWSLQNEFNMPSGLAVNAQGDVVVADMVASRVATVDPLGKTVKTILDKTANLLNYPRDVATHQGKLFVADFNNNRIVTLEGGSTFAVLAGGQTKGHQDGKGAAAQLAQPRGIGVDASGNLYVVEEAGAHIHKITPAGDATTLPVSGTLTSGHLNDLAVSSSGDLFVSENYAIKKIAEDCQAWACTVDSNCIGVDTGNVCTESVCKNGQCTAQDIKLGTACGADTGNVCTENVCQSGQCAAQDIKSGTACGGDNTCDGKGKCGGLCRPVKLYTKDNCQGEEHVAWHELNLCSQYDSAHKSLNDAIRSVALAPGVEITLHGDCTQSLGASKTWKRATAADPQCLDVVGSGPAGASWVKIVKGCACNVKGDCDDGIVCTKDNCVQGKCTRTNEPTDCGDDANDCTAASHCSTSLAKCTHPHKGMSGGSSQLKCSVNKCTDDVCKDGVCKAGAAKICDDGNACTKDSCDASSGCVTSIEVDGVGCGTGKTCKAGVCAETQKCGNKKIDADETCDDGNLTSGDGCSSACVRECKTPSTSVSTVAGSLPGWADGKGAAARFNEPHGLAFDSKDNLYVADKLNNRIRKVTSGGTVITFAGSAYGLIDGQGAAASFKKPVDVAIDGTDNLYVAGLDSKALRFITPQGVVTTIASDNASLTFGTFYGAAVTSAGIAYIVSADTYWVRKVVNGQTPQVTTLAGKKSTPGFTNGMGTAATFRQPRGIAIDAAGTTIYVADTGNQAIRKIVVSTGVVSTWAGGTKGLLNGKGTAARFSSPAALEVTGSGLVYVADTSNKVIRRIAKDGAVSTYAGIASGGYLDGDAVAAKFQKPAGIAVNSKGVVYIADTDNHRIRKIESICKEWSCTNASYCDDSNDCTLDTCNPKSSVCSNTNLSNGTVCNNTGECTDGVCK